MRKSTQIISRLESMLDGCAAACGEKNLNFSELIPRFGDILKRDGPFVEIGSRSVFPNSAVGEWQ